MKGVLLQRAIKLNRNHKQKKRWQRLVRTMATTVVFCTTYALILPAITMEQQAVCGLEPHVHEESCYVQQTVSVWKCGLEEGTIAVHSHDTLCYDAQGQLICTLPENKEHVHGEGCYTQSQEPTCGYSHEHGTDCVKVETVLVCGQEETPPHVHTEECTTELALICTLQESQGHAHSDACVKTEQKLICTEQEGETHTHGDGCYETVQIPCQIPEAEGHTHGDGCYERREIPCTQETQPSHTHDAACYGEKASFCDQPTTAEHVHTDSCYTKTLTCGMKELQLHTHGESCRDAQGNLICQLPQVVAHAHTNACLPQGEQTLDQLVCQLQEHTHDESCYPAEDGTNAEYLCGGGVHAHVESCYDESGALICTIPEHQHDETCMVLGYDPNADVETREDWEQTLKDVTLTGVWSEDLLAVAKSQLGYAESTRNVRLEGEKLNGYTRYGAKFDLPYGDWDAMFVAFCLEYAEITPEYIPYETDTAKWVHALKDAGRYADAQDHTPAAGDLVFLDTNGDEEADHVGIFTETCEDGSYRLLSGDTKDGCVAYETVEDGIVGYGVLPENPLTPEQWQSANAMADKLAALPTVEEVRAGFQSLNDQGDKAGHEALRQELVARMDAILAEYETFNDLQKARAGSLDRLYALQELCGGVTWRQHPALTDDSAVVVGLTADSAVTVPGAESPEEEGLLPTNLIRNGDLIRYSFTVETESYYTDIHYGEALVKVELVLPFTREEALFELSEMTWLENAVETMEVRSINGQDTACQVVTGYKRLAAQDENTVVVPGSFTETASVRLNNMSHGDKLSLIISAAMEHGTWEGLCQTHQIPEKLTIATDSLKIYAPLSAEEQQAKYEEYLAQLNMLAPNGEQVNRDVLDALLEKIVEDFRTGALSEEQYADLNERILELSGVDLQSIAEPSLGNGWYLMDFGDPNFVAETTVLYSSARTSGAPVTSAMPAALSSSLGLTSGSQINYAGGENYDNGGVWVSKMVSGTEQENVFDITLQIITSETVETVYNDPDMAVVIVMDISNTMTSKFTGQDGTTRYNAAMTSAEQFLENFANNTSGISKVGYVAFNTHGHEVFPMQQCTTSNWKTLANTMRTKTAQIMSDAAAAVSNGKYDSSHDRFTNMEAGLKMAEDMLAGVSNEHKYVIFLSDGFPTTYVKSGYTGYDPYTSSGTKDTDGVFYDDVMNVHCDYGTSYSDTAAIKARQKAVSMKKSGINIFSIGIDVAGQTIYQYHWDSKLRLKSASTVERRREASYYNTNGYEIGTLHSELTVVNITTKEEDAANYPKKYLTQAQRDAMSQDFKDWLKGTATTGIGSGYYFESGDAAGLEQAYKDIFTKIQEMNKAGAALDWVASDPMPEMGVHELETMEFISFWDIYGQEQPVLMSSLTRDDEDAPLENHLYDNTATFDTTNSTISWDLKNSGYASMAFGDNKNYQYVLRYRVRLQNENTGFIENNIYDTNDTTFLNYRVIEETNGVPDISDLKYIEFPIPEVFGYLSELQFLKTDPVGTPIPGVKFQLTHDTASCGTCRGDGVGYVNLPVYEAVSDDDGKVTFTNLPSGHHYIMTETETPDEFIPTTNTYKIQISYDTLTVNVTDENGNALEWNNTVENDSYYVLPHTGSVGVTSHYALGSLLIVAAALLYVTKFGRKHRRGGKYSQ